MKERIMLDPAKVKKHSAALMENNPHNRHYTKHLMMESGLTSAQLEGYTHVSPDEAADLADLLGCDLSDLVPNREVTERSRAIATAPTAPADSGPMCSRKGCYKRALPGKKICQEHMDIVMAGKNRTAQGAPAEHVEVSGPDDLLKQIGVSLESLDVIDDVPQCASPVDHNKQVVSEKNIPTVIKLRLELHAALLGNLASTLFSVGADKEEVLCIIKRAQSLAEELAGVR